MGFLRILAMMWDRCDDAYSQGVCDILQMDEERFWEMMYWNVNPQNNAGYCRNCESNPCQEIDDMCEKVWRRIQQNERETEAGFDSRSNH